VDESFKREIQWAEILINNRRQSVYNPLNQGIVMQAVTAVLEQIDWNAQLLNPFAPGSLIEIDDNRMKTFPVYMFQQQVKTAK